MGFKFDLRPLNRAIEAEQKRMQTRKRQTAEDVKDYWIGEIKDLTPIDEGHLTESITGRVEQTPDSTKVIAYVPSNHQAASYAIKMHEGIYNLGKKSRSKQARVGKTVGAHYITRPLDYGRGKIREISRDGLEIESK